MASPSQERVGSYRLLRLIGIGQVCELWEVNRSEGAERLAMKLIPPGAKHTREQINILRREYQVGEQLSHPKVISTCDFVSGRHGTALVMELFRYPNLKQRIQQGLDWVAYYAEEILRDAAVGLAYIHDQGWIHRDVKPDNLLVGDAGEVRWIDFALMQRRKGALGKLLASKTAIQGTQSYISPEQIRGRVLDARADVYSFGCTVYEMIAGRPPFTGVNTQELLTKHLKSPPPSLEAAGRDVTPEFAELVRRMIAKDPNGRPATLQDILREIGSLHIYKNPPPAPQQAGKTRADN